MTKPDKRERLIELLGVGSKNFLGTGLTMHECLQLERAERIAASWCLQSKDERFRRLRAVMQLSVELERVRVETCMSIGVMPLAIQAVIEGDWALVAEWVSDMTPPGEAEADTRFATFRELLSQLLRTQKESPA